MNKFKLLSIYILTGLNIFLLFLSIFSDKILLPSSLQYFGKFHPVILHFPIVLILLSSAIIIFKSRIAFNDDRIFSIVFNVTSYVSVITAILGMFLFKQGEYDQSTVKIHQWIGVGISIISFLVLLLSLSGISTKIIVPIAWIQVPLILIGSHEGASLTHGEDFLSFNNEIEEVKKLEITDSSKIYQAFIEPIFSSKCFSCHNEKKAKGNLIMTNITLLLKGGKNGKIWEEGDPINSHIIQRANLSEEDKKHMPPKGKPQLTIEELDLLHAWISNGAPIEKRLIDYPETDSFRILLAKYIPKETNTTIEKFIAADPSIIQKLQNAHCIIRKKSIESPALQVRFSIREGFQTNLISELNPIKEQVTEIHCSNMPLTDSSILMFSMFPNLENLNINGTGIGNAGIQNLLKVTSLKKLSISNNPIDGSGLKMLLQLPNLRKVFCWSTLADSTIIGTLKKSKAKIDWEDGYIPDATELLQLTMPMLEDQELLVLSKKDAIRFKHPMPGVNIKYTTDGSAPDSLNSTNYNQPIKINVPTRIRTIAIKKGWLTSDTTDHYFFPKPDTPDFARLITLPEEKYKSDGVRTLFNAKKGNLNNISENWLGYKNGPLDAIFMFSKNQTFHELIISALKKTGPYVLPPEKIELWAGNDSANLKKIYTYIPKQPQKYEADQNEIYHIPLKNQSRFFRIKIYPVDKLPKWHAGKGDKGWTFVDEVFFY